MSAVEKLDNIEAICFFPKDFDGSRRFFEDKWGFQPKRIQPTVENPNFIEYSFRGATIAIWARDAVAEIMGEQNLMDEAHNFMTAIKVPRVEDVDEIYEDFTSKGVVCISKPETFGFGSRPPTSSTMSAISGRSSPGWREGTGPRSSTRKGNPYQKRPLNRFSGLF